MRYATLMVVTTVLFSIHGTGRAAQKIELKWNEVAQYVAGRTVQMVLPDGIRLKGPVLNVTSEALVIEIKKASNRKAYPKGRFSVPRSSVSVLRIKQVKGRWKAIGTAIGAVAMTALILPSAAIRDNEVGLKNDEEVIVVSLIAGAGAAGYFLGRAADERVTIITIIREEASADQGEP